MVSAWERALGRNEGPAAPVKRKYQDLTPAGRAELRRSVVRRNLAPPPQPERSTRQSESQRSLERFMPTYENTMVQQGEIGELTPEYLRGEAVRTAELARDVFTPYQEFKAAEQAASEGRAGAAAGWGLLGLAGMVPLVGDVAQGLGAAGRAAGLAGDVARGAERAADVGRAVGTTKFPVRPAIPERNRYGREVAEQWRARPLTTLKELEDTGKTLYHGTPQQFERFDSSAATLRGRGKFPTRSRGYFYFTEDPNVAASFRQNVSDISVGRWLDFNRDSMFEYEDLRDPEIFNMFIEDVVRSTKNKDLQIARDDYAENWQSIRPEDLTVEDVLDFDYPLRAVSSRGQVVKTRVFGNELDLTGLLDPMTMPDGLREAMEADNLLVPWGGGFRSESWRTHEKGIPNTIAWMRENGYGRAVVPDAYEAGGQSIIALEEFIEYGQGIEGVADRLGVK